MNFEEFKNNIKNVAVGKHLPDALYLHKSVLDNVPDSLKAFIVDAISNLNLSTEPWTVLKLYKREFTISLLNYPELYNEGFPSLTSSCFIDLQDLGFAQK